MFNKVFISYASEDLLYAERLYKYLKESGFRPWVDKIELLPGMKWDFHIQNELRNADFIILLLSNRSVIKRGYVQKEFNKAIEYCEEKLDSDIYVIPVKLDDCDVPEKLQRFQWIPFTEEESFAKIYEALEVQRKKLEKANQVNEAINKGVELEDKRESIIYGEHPPRYIVDLKYRIFKNVTNSSFEELNIIIKHEVIQNLLIARNRYFNFLSEFGKLLDEEDLLLRVDSETSTDLDFFCFGKNFVSYRTFWYHYPTGAAHGMYGYAGHNYLLNPLRELDFWGLCNTNSDFWKKLSRKVNSNLCIQYPDLEKWENAIEAKQESFSNYYFKNKELVFIYNPYDIAAFAFGVQEVHITFDELKNLFYDEQKMIDFLDSI